MLLITSFPGGIEHVSATRASDAARVWQPTMGGLYRTVQMLSPGPGKSQAGPIATLQKVRVSYPIQGHRGEVACRAEAPYRA